MATTPSTHTPLVHIARPAAHQAVLSPAQQEFNGLAERIGRLEQELGAFRAAATELRRLAQDDYRPLQARHNEQRAALVQVLDHAIDHNPKLTQAERGQLADLIAHGCRDLPDKGFPELRPLVAKYAPPPPSATQAAAAAQATAEKLRADFERRYGFEFDPAADLRTPEQVLAYVRARLAEEQAATAAGRQARAERRAARRKSPGQQAAAEHQQAEAQHTTKAVRTLYLDLVKHLHPDREPDEAEKTRKTELLKQVTTAYEASELLTLLRLQLELRRIDQAHLETLADEQLRYYNRLLREQARELGEVFRHEQAQLAAFTGRPVAHRPAPAALLADYERQKAQLLARTRQLAANVISFRQDPAALKAWLKSHR